MRRQVSLLYPEFLTLPCVVAMNKDEVLLLADEYFSGFIVDLEQDPDQSKLRCETGHDFTEEFFSFVNILLHLHGVTTNL